jgi:hypothetical protein
MIYSFSEQVKHINNQIHSHSIKRDPLILKFTNDPKPFIYVPIGHRRFGLFAHVYTARLEVLYTITCEPGQITPRHRFPGPV